MQRRKTGDRLQSFGQELVPGLKVLKNGRRGYSSALEVLSFPVLIRYHRMKPGLNCPNLLPLRFVVEFEYAQPVRIVGKIQETSVSYVDIVSFAAMHILAVPVAVISRLYRIEGIRNVNRPKP